LQSTLFSGGLSLTGSLNSINTFGFKNRIINGAMVIDQRNAGASVTPPLNGTYTLDRWVGYSGQNSKFTVQQNAGSVTPPAGFTNYIGVTSLSAYSAPNTETYAIAQYIEGYNVADLGWGTANAKTVTISAWVRSSLTGTFGGALTNSAYSRSYPFTYSIPVANTWTQISVTIAGDTAGTWLTTNGIGVRVWFSLGGGYAGTAGAWAATEYETATGATSVVGTSGATFYITGVQLEVGTNATSFDYRPYGTELALCQRYYQTGLTAFGSSATSGFDFRAAVSLPVVMRTSPTIVGTNIANSGFAAVSGTFSYNSNSIIESRTSNASSTTGYFQSTLTISAEL
jgi:hypothetical protein